MATSKLFVPEIVDDKEIKKKKRRILFLKEVTRKAKGELNDKTKI